MPRVQQRRVRDVERAREILLLGLATLALLPLDLERGLSFQLRDERELLRLR